MVKKQQAVCFGIFYLFFILPNKRAPKSISSLHLFIYWNFSNHPVSQAASLGYELKNGYANQ
jgi:hypothetical protein